MNVVVLSAFRNAVNHLNRYFDQVLALREHGLKNDNSFSVRVVACEGDSTDKTLHDLKWMKLSIDSRVNVSIVKYDHGGPAFGSVESVERMTALTGVMKVMLAQVDHVRVFDHMVLYVESDLIWTPHDVGSIIDRAWERGGFDVVAPLVFAGDNFYDVYCYRGLDGSRFAPYAPYHSSMKPKGEITEVSSVGSCLAFRAGLARTIEPVGKLGLISFCAGVRKAGFRIGVDPRFRVEHP